MTSSPIGLDNAIQGSVDDELERSWFVERLTAAVINPATAKSTGTVIGITGPWGSGKTSILNMLQEHVEAKYNDAVIVRFDPWLVSGRNDLIAEFLGEIIGTINADKRRNDEFKRLGKTLAQYGAQLAPIGSLFVPGAGEIFLGGFRSIEKALSGKASLSGLRAKLEKELSKLSAPIVVLIDEIDRVEDEEIRAVVQLVRSVADFPEISYVLAFDSERVVQALGVGVPDEHREERGKAYLEKIVQLQIPLPVTLDAEVARLVTTELSNLRKELQLPKGFENDERYQNLLKTLTVDVIRTLRDIRRLVGTYQVLRGMLIGEVDWIDLLAFSALQVKSPATVERVRNHPADYVESSIYTQGATRSMQLEEMSPSERLDAAIPESERNSGTKKLLSALFPQLAQSQRSDIHHSDALRQYRPLLTTLRLGLLPGEFSRDDVRGLLKASPGELQSRLQRIYQEGALAPLMSRIDDLYLDFESFDYGPFWQGVGKFVKKPDCEWMDSYKPMREVVEEFAEILQRAVRRRNEFRKGAAQIFLALSNSGESELTSYWLRHHMKTLRVAGKKQHLEDDCFLDARQTKQLAGKMTKRWRNEHLSGDLIPCRWDVQPLYAMIETGMWDEQCRGVLDSALLDDKALIGFTLLLFGGIYSTDKSVISGMCNYDAYIDRITKLSNSKSAARMHGTVRAAVRKALDLKE